MQQKTQKTTRIQIINHSRTRLIRRIRMTRLKSKTQNFQENLNFQNRKVKNYPVRDHQHPTRKGLLIVLTVAGRGVNSTDVTIIIAVTLGVAATTEFQGAIRRLHILLHRPQAKNQKNILTALFTLGH